MKIKRIGKWFIFGGLLLIAAALCLIVYNINEQTQAANAAADVLQQIEEQKDRNGTPGTTAAETDDTNSPDEELEIPDYLRNPNMPLPEMEIDGEMYIGTVSVPELGLQLPVMSEWSYPRLKISPCRYQGSPYLDNLIILAHNYQSHFGTLINLQIGADVYFEDVDGHVFHYEVVEIETLDGTAIEDMASGEWDLTLFTCTVGGKSRVTVRCERAKS